MRDVLASTPAVLVHLDPVSFGHFVLTVLSHCLIFWLSFGLPGFCFDDLVPFSFFPCFHMWYSHAILSEMTRAWFLHADSSIRRCGGWIGNIRVHHDKFETADRAAAESPVVSGGGLGCLKLLFLSVFCWFLLLLNVPG